MAYKQVSLRRLFSDDKDLALKQKVKESYDKQYEVEIQKLSKAYYDKKRKAGVTDTETKEYLAKKTWCWNLYQITAVGAGLWQVESTEGAN